MTRALRAVAVVVALGGVIDPVFTVNRREPPRVDFVVRSSASALRARDRVMHDLGGQFLVNTGEPPDAVVIVGEPELEAVPAGVPVSVVMPVAANARNIRLIGAEAPAPVLVGQEAIIRASFEAVALGGESSAIQLKQNGITLAATEHRWTGERERFTTTLGYVPPAAGITQLTVAAAPAAGEATDDDNAADLALLASARTLRVAVYEPRPSWAVGFIRRAIESDPLFSTSSLVRPARGRVVTAGPPLRSLSSESLAPYDALLVGAPEELTASEVAALTAFCELRGGAVILVPDRRPSGPYASLISPSGFDDVLLDRPVALVGDGPIGITGSEFALPRRLGAGAIAVGSLTQQDARVAMVSLPRGRGRIVFSGALDAWRFRAADRGDVAFTRFWTGIVANLAAASPRPVSISVQPALAAPGDRLRVRAAVNAPILRQPGGDELTVTASLVASDGAPHFVRLWPAAEVGIFEGEAVAPAVGSYDARVMTSGSAADTPVVVASGVRHPPAYDEAYLRLIAETTGGVVVDAADLTPLQGHLRSLRRRDQPRAFGPMRSGWWSLPFAAALSAEWAWRRRRGER
jgi:hypothetical protein